MRKKLCDGEISPIMYYMVIEGLSAGDLSKRAGIPMGKMKKHLDVKGFELAKMSELCKYARVFNIPVANLFQVVVSADGKNTKYHFYNEEDHDETLTVNQQQTKNKYIIITQAEEVKK